jgi:hypothetical protein
MDNPVRQRHRSDSLARGRLAVTSASCRDSGREIIEESRHSRFDCELITYSSNTCVGELTPKVAIGCEPDQCFRDGARVSLRYEYSGAALQELGNSFPVLTSLILGRSAKSQRLVRNSSYLLTEIEAFEWRCGGYHLPIDLG